jgi:phage gp29-like protein
MQKSFTQELATLQNVDFYSFSSIFPDPDSVLASQGRGISLYRELLHDPHVKACTMSRKSGVVSKPWQLDGDKSTVELITVIFESFDFQGFLQDVLNAPLFGYQPIEVIWALNDGLFAPERLSAKPQEWFCFDYDNNLRLKSPKSLYEGEIVPDKKFLCPKYNATYTNPYGEKLLSNVFWPVSFKKGGIKFWVSFAEKYGMPWALGKIPRQTLEEEALRLRDALDSMVQDGVAVFDDACSVELVESGSKAQSSQVYTELVTFMNDEISKAILGQTLTTQIGATGSYAASSVHQEVREDILQSDIRLVETTVNQLINWIMAVNYPSVLPPKFSFTKAIDIKSDLAARDKVLKDTGVSFSKDYFIRTYGLSEVDFELQGGENV